jgi:hypothetical protein
MADAYLPGISSNTSLAVEAALLNGSDEISLAGEEEEYKGGVLVAGAFLRFTSATLPVFSGRGRAYRGGAAAPGAHAIPAGPAGFPPCTTTLPCRLRAGAVAA